MAGKPTQFSTTQLVILFTVGVIVGGCLLFGITYVVQNGMPNFLTGTSGASNLTPISVSYGDVYRYVNSRVMVDGYAIIANETNNVCGSVGWSTCKVWFSNDPVNSGLGIHEIKLGTGNKPDAITQNGDLYDHNGSHLDLVKTDQFSWYHVRIIGVVEQCQNVKCTILVDTIYASR